jgi:hypothetical protein
MDENSRSEKTCHFCANGSLNPKKKGISWIGREVHRRIGRFVPEVKEKITLFYGIFPSASGKQG